MPKKSSLPLEMVSIRLYRGDRAVLQDFYAADIGYNIAIREIVHRHCRKLLEIEARAMPTRPLQLEEITDDGALDPTTFPTNGG